jgi:hypothetical protein
VALSPSISTLFLYAKSLDLKASVLPELSLINVSVAFASFFDIPAEGAPLSNRF